MEFTVTFVGGFWRDSLQGLQVVDLARQQLAVPALEAALVGEIVYHNAASATAVLSEAQARQAGGFETRANRRVEVASHSASQALADFIDPVAEARRDPATDAVLGVTWHWEIDIEGIVAAWFAAGCPAKWPRVKVEQQ